MSQWPLADARQELHALERQLVTRAEDIAVFLVYDRPERAAERPGLARTHFAERCVSDEQLGFMIDAFRSVNAYAELFEGERPFMEALACGRLQRLERPLSVAYNGIGWGVGVDGFQRGRKALIPLIADSYGLICANSDAYACALTLHKFHSFLVIAALGVSTPQTWHFEPSRGWIGGRPPAGVRVIVKSTYEAWSVGVTEESVFVVDESCDRRVAEIARQIGQAATVQAFIPGTEVYVPVMSCPERIVMPPVEAVIRRAAGDPDAVMTIDDNLERGVGYRRFDGPKELIERLGEDALTVFEGLQLQGLTRIDFRIDEGGRPWVIDVAVSPGLSLRSPVFLSASEIGLDHPTFLRAVVAATIGSEGRL